MDGFHSPAVGDLDEDGDLDIVAAARGVDMDGAAPVGALAVFPGDGAGGVGPEVTVPAFEQTVGVQVADFDGDGHLDLYVDTDNGDLDWGNDLGRILFGDGAGGFSDLHVLPSGDGEVADLDADGKPDVARTTADGIEVFLNRWDGRPD